MRQRLLCAPRLGDLLVAAQANTAAGSAEATELSLLQRRREQALRVPDDLVQALAEIRSRALLAWEEAREARRFDGFAPLLAELLQRTRERGAALSRGGDAYDALLDEHEPGACQAAVGPLLEALREPLLQLAARAARPGPPPAWLRGPRYPDAAQEALCRELLERVGFDFQRGRLDRSSHPFTLYAGSSDVRLTVRIDEADPLPAIFGALHEGGHGLYDQGYQAADRHRLLGAAPGIAMHEAQARLWENIVGRGRPFWTAAYTGLQARFPDPLGGVALDAFLGEVRRIRPGLVRVDADEVTYNLHVLLRYRLEVALVRGDLAVADLPGAWQEGMGELLGLCPPDDRLGCLQDVHWALGSFGYFPTYALGNLYAAQLYQAWQHAQPEGEQDLARGDCSGLLGWLRAQVHQMGHRLPSEELLRSASGAGLSAAPYLAYLERRYG